MGGIRIIQGAVIPDRHAGGSGRDRAVGIPVHDVKKEDQVIFTRTRFFCCVYRLFGIEHLVWVVDPEAVDRCFTDTLITPEQVRFFDFQYVRE